MNTVFIYKSGEALRNDEPEETWHEAPVVPRIGDYIDLWSEIGKKPKTLYKVTMLKWFNAAQVGTHLHAYIIVNPVET